MGGFPASIGAEFAPHGMIREQGLLGPHRRPTGQAALALIPPQGPNPTPAPRARLVALPAGAGPGGIEAGIISDLVQGELPAGSLLDTLAFLTAEALQQAPNGAAGSNPAMVRGVAARIATGLAVALLESDLADRITARLAAEAPFAEGWLSCPE
jgi:hypothetical protein